MKAFLVLASICSFAFLTGCETKVINEQPNSKGNPMVIERERPVIIEKEQPTKPDVQTNIHVDR
jgi:hypothetical protein